MNRTGAKQLAERRSVTKGKLGSLYTHGQVSGHFEGHGARLDDLQRRAAAGQPLFPFPRPNERRESLVEASIPTAGYRPHAGGG